jgi:hypothetical protein
MNVQNGSGTRTQRLNFCGTHSQRFIPADGLPTGSGFQLRVGDAMGALDPCDMIFQFGAGKPGGKGTIRITLNLEPTICCSLYNKRTGIRTIHGAGCDLTD